MPKIFISYRRDDSEFVVDLIYQKLVSCFGDDSVFMDVDTIPKGVDFRKHLNDAVKQCDVLLAVIGKHWLDLRKDDGTRRLDDPTDFVRIEIQAALERDIPVIPILLGDVTMPGDDELPDELADLAFRNAAEIRRGKHFENHLDELVRDTEIVAKKHADAAPKPVVARQKETEPRSVRFVCASCGAKYKLPKNKEGKTVHCIECGKPGRVGEHQDVETQQIITNSIGMKLALIPAGEFMMGSHQSPEDIVRLYDGNIDYVKDEFPQHRVRITKPFYIGVYPVTQAEFERVMGWNRSEFKNDNKKTAGLDTSHHPVEWIYWDHATRFCDELSANEGRLYRLPTEAEWEYACRAGTETAFFFGDDPSKLDEYAWTLNNSGKRTFAVGQKKPNAWGLYDIYGNVYEWCQDWYDENYYQNSPTDDPKGPSSASMRVLRGSQFCSDNIDSRSSHRYQRPPDQQGNIMGFRVVMQLS